MVGATRRNEHMVKVHPHVGDMLLNKMNEQGMTVSQLADKADIDVDVVLSLMNKSRLISPKLSDKIGPVLGMGKTTLYKAHMRFMESGGA